MFSLSTSWNSSKHNNGFNLVREIKALGFDTIELGFSLTENVVEDILTMKEASRIKVLSLHNICPLPNEVEPDEASPDYYSLASPDEEERSLAVDVTKKTIDYANRFGAKAVILHTGRVQIKDRTKDLAELIGDEKRFNKLKGEMIKERNEKKKGYLDNVMRSLDDLVPYAKKMHVLLAIENRYYYREMPLMEELDEIFKNFEVGDLFYWHDVGHAEVFERLGLARHKDLLERFQNRLIGVHLHDIIDLINDHKAPGAGTFDFRLIKPYMNDNMIKVIEVHQPATADEIRRGVEHLKILE